MFKVCVTITKNKTRFHLKEFKPLTYNCFVQDIPLKDNNTIICLGQTETVILILSFNHVTMLFGICYTKYSYSLHCLVRLQGCYFLVESENLCKGLQNEMKCNICTGDKNNVTTLKFKFFSTVCTS